jgi:hypothetical protein
MIALLAVLAATQAAMPAGASEASSALSLCAIGQVQARISGRDSADAIADAALAGCAAQQQRLWDALGASLGPISESEKSQVLGPMRARIIRVVNECRVLVPRQEDEATVAGDCIRRAAPAVAARPGPVEAGVDILLARCSAEAEAVRASLVRDRGEASAERIMPGFLHTLRAFTLRQLQRARARR